MQDHLYPWLMRVAAVYLFLFSAPTLAQGVEENAAVLWANRLEDAIWAGQYDADMFNDRWFVREALRPFRLDQDEMVMFQDAGFSEALVETLTQAVANGGSYTFLRLRGEGVHTTALFRLHSEGGVNYHEWRLRQRGDGSVESWDVEYYFTGERISETVRWNWVPLLNDVAPGYADHMDAESRLRYRHWHDLDDLRHAAEAGRYSRVLALYDALPEPLQALQKPMFFAMVAHLGLGDQAAHDQVRARYAELYPDATDAELGLIDAMFVVGAYEGICDAADALEARIGGDPQLNILRADAVHLLGDYEQAKRFLDAGLAENPRELALIWRSIDLALFEEDWSRVSEMLTAAEAQGVELLDVREVEGYEGYVASGAYERWLAGDDDAGDGAAEGWNGVDSPEAPGE
ncbi:MAG: hypothetical protein AAGA29_11940 [Planctomycetota bacterium]